MTDGSTVTGHCRVALSSQALLRLTVSVSPVDVAPSWRVESVAGAATPPASTIVGGSKVNSVVPDEAVAVTPPAAVAAAWRPELRLSE